VLCVVARRGLGMRRLIGPESFPPSDEAQFRIDLKAPIGTRVEETERTVRGMENVVRATLKADELISIVSDIGIPQGQAAVFTSNSGPHSAAIQAYLTPADRRTRSDREIVSAVREQFAGQFPAATYRFVSGGIVSRTINFGSETTLEVELLGYELASAEALAGEGRRILKLTE